MGTERCTLNLSQTIQTTRLFYIGIYFSLSAVPGKGLISQYLIVEQVAFRLQSMENMDNIKLN